MKFTPANNYILYIGSYPPRECGIATFTQDLATAFDKKFNPVVKSKICALNEQPTSIYNYEKNRVIHQIAATELEHYVSLAREINTNPDIKIVNIQHEFGIFGGTWGDYIIPFLQVLEKPVVTTFHSVLPNPDEHLLKVVRFLGLRSKALVIMNRFSSQVLVREYDIPQSKIVFIPHGIPQVPYEASHLYKKEFNLEDKIILSTFGLLSPDKGIEYAIRALPEVVEKFPNLIYLIIGETHPVVRKDQGEAYRNFLVKEVERLGLEKHVQFYNKYITLDEITRFLRATDIYVSPTLAKTQSVSGTLSYALGVGRPVISTPTEYAKSIVKPDLGILVKFRSVKNIKKALLKLISNEKLRVSISANAYEATRPMIWANVAAAYFDVYRKFADLKPEEKKLPDIKMDHLMRLTDDFGLIHHARYSKPERRFGYSLDDNARALIAALAYFEKNQKPEILGLIKTYLNFIKFVERPSGNFANIVSLKKRRDATSADDVQGRAIWALGETLSKEILPEEVRKAARKMFMKSLTNLKKIEAPRAIAFAMIGLYRYLNKFPNAKLSKIFQSLADRQVELYKNFSSPDWRWFEEQLTYSNSKLPESLYYAYALTHDAKYLKVAETALGFLRRITFEKGKYIPIGQNGWYFRHKKRAYFDQQPEDTASMVQTKVLAFQITKNPRHLEDAFTAFQWFLGKNHLSQMVYDEVTGGCHDGLGQYAMNLNQGAESTTSYLLARLALEEIKTEEAPA